MRIVKLRLKLGYRRIENDDCFAPQEARCKQIILVVAEMNVWFACVIAEMCFVCAAY